MMSSGKLRPNNKVKSWEADKTPEINPFIVKTCEGISKAVDRQPLPPREFSTPPTTIVPNTNVRVKQRKHPKKILCNKRATRRFR